MPGNEADYVLAAGAEAPDELTPADAGVPIEKWGKDHWSVLLYIESICVDGVKGIGKPDLRRIQANLNRHPGLLVNMDVDGTPMDGAKYGIRLAGGKELPGPDYDEWDCVRDLECYGLVESLGTGVNPLFKMTERGNGLAADIRKWRTGGGTLATFHTEGGGD